jgi:hypothetical protein
MITNTDLLPQRYHFLLGMVKDLNVFPFDNDLKKAHFGIKLCVYIMRKQFQYIKETLFLLYILKNLVIKVFIQA